MQKQYLYEYAVIRVVPRVEREEFFNAGLILFSKSENYIQIRVHLPEEKVRLFAPGLDPAVLQIHLDAFEKVGAGSPDSGRIGQMEVPERFRWLTAVRSASLQTSRPHSGLTEDLDATFEKLFTELVL